MARVRPETDAPDTLIAEEEGRERGGIQSLERAFAILEQIARSRDGVSLAELSRRLGLHSSTAFHLVQTMVRLGYVRQAAESRRYRIGRPLFALAAASREEVELTSFALPILEELSRATGETGHFGVWSEHSVLVLAKTPGAGAFQMAGNAGVLRPAYCTALGKAMLASLRPDERARYLAMTRLEPRSARTLTDPERLLRQLAEIERDGLAFDDGEFDPEVRCIAGVVRDFTAGVVGAIGISGPVWRLSLQALQEKAPLVRTAAKRLSAALGCPESGAGLPGEA